MLGAFYLCITIRMDLIIVKAALTQVLERLGYMTVCLEKLMYAADEDTVLQIMEQPGPMDSEVWRTFACYAWGFINGDIGALDSILKLFLSEIELLSNVRRSLGERLRLLGSSEHDLLYSDPEEVDAWEDILLG